MVGWPRTMVSWDPWLELRRLERDLGARRDAPAQFPQLRATTDEKGVRLRALVPGFAIEELEISVRGDELTLRGKRKAEAAAEVQDFERSLKLPFPIEVEKVKALAKDGVLEIDLPRAAADSPRRIQIQAG
jgi:HSP20 family protein